MVMVTITNHALVPPGLEVLAANISRGFGVDLDTAAFLIIDALAFASGNSILIKTPEGQMLRPAFNLALISNGAGFPRGALATLISPLLNFVATACAEECERGVEAVRNAVEAKATLLNEIQQRIAKNEQAFAKVKARNATANNVVDRISRGGQMLPGEFAKVQATPFNFSDQDTLENNLTTDYQAFPLVTAELQMLRLAAGPGIIVDEPDWNAIPELTEASFDKVAVALFFSGVRQLSLSRTAEMALIARALRATHPGKSEPNIIACAGAEVFTQVLANPAVRKSGMFSSFAFVETKETGDCDPAAIEAARGDGTWLRLCKAIFLTRVTRGQKVLELNHASFRAYAAFRAWWRQECPPAMRTSVECWPDLCLRMALTLAIVANTASVTLEQVDCAATFLKARLLPTISLIERLTSGETPEQQRESRIERICRKLNHGPLTKRGIVRTMHQQDYGVVDRMIAEAMQAGRMEQRGDFFYARNVSVSASAISG